MPVAVCGEDAFVIRQALDFFDDGLLTITSDYRIDCMNAAFAGALGYDPAEIRGRPYTELVAPESRQEASAAIAHTMMGLDIPGVELAVLSKSGRIHSLYFEGAPLHAADGTLRGIIAIAPAVRNQIREGHKA